VVKRVGESMSSHTKTNAKYIRQIGQSPFEGHKTIIHLIPKSSKENGPHTK